MRSPRISLEPAAASRSLNCCSAAEGYEDVQAEVNSHSREPVLNWLSLNLAGEDREPLPLHAPCHHLGLHLSFDGEMPDDPHLADLREAEHAIFEPEPGLGVHQAIVHVCSLEPGKAGFQPRSLPRPVALEA